MTTLERIRGRADEIRAIAAAHGARNLRVVGSIARGTDREESDLDLLVTFDAGVGLLDARELADRLNRSVCRFWIDGLGWQEALRFGSALTGRGYLARNPMPGVVPRTGASIQAPEGAAANECVQDVLETLALDLDDVEYLEPSRVTEELPRWELWRQDDNGNKVCIRTLSSRAKAERAVADFERGGHRQMYWVSEALRGRGAREPT